MDARMRNLLIVFLLLGAGFYGLIKMNNSGGEGGGCPVWMQMALEKHVQAFEDGMALSGASSGDASPSEAAPGLVKYMQALTAPEPLPDGEPNVSVPSSRWEWVCGKPTGDYQIVVSGDDEKDVIRLEAFAADREKPIFSKEYGRPGVGRRR